MRRDFRETKSPVVMIIPMIDIMLFLLIFFMLSTMYMVETNSIMVSLPSAKSTTVETRKDIVSITVTKDGNVLFGKDTVPNEAVAEKIQATLQDNADAIFVLRGDKKVEYEYVVQVLDILKRSGAKHVSIAAEARGGL